MVQERIETTKTQEAKGRKKLEHYYRGPLFACLFRLEEELERALAEIRRGRGLCSSFGSSFTAQTIPGGGRRFALI